MKTIEQLEEEITQLNKKTNRLRRDLEALKVQPEPLTGRVLDEGYEGDCFTVMTNGLAYRDRHSNDYMTQGRQFYDLESAERFSLFERLQQRERVAAAKAWEDVGKVLDWWDKYQYKYHAVLHHAPGVVKAHRALIVQSRQLHFPSEESLLAFYSTLKKDEQKLLCTGVE